MKIAIHQMINNQIMTQIKEHHMLGNGGVHHNQAHTKAKRRGTSASRSQNEEKQKERISLLSTLLVTSIIVIIMMWFQIVGLHDSIEIHNYMNH